MKKLVANIMIYYAKIMVIINDSIMRFFRNIAKRTKNDKIRNTLIKVCKILIKNIIKAIHILSKAAELKFS